MRRAPIRAKLAATLAAPLLPLLVLTTFQVRQAGNEVDQIRSEIALATSATGPTSIVTRIQDERSWASLELTGLESSYQVPVVGYDATRAATDEAVTSFRADVEAEGGTVETVYRDALGALDGLAAIRGDIDQDTGLKSLENMPFSTEVYDRYTEVVAQLLDANARIALRVRDAELRKGTELAELAIRQFEVMANLTRETLVNATLSPGGLDTREEINRTSALLSSFDRNNRDIEGTRGVFAPIVREHHPAEIVTALHDRVVETMETGQVADFDAFLTETTVEAGEGFPAMREEIIERVEDRADELDAAATTRQRLFVFLGLGSFVLAASMIWVISRSITRPLQSLTVQATDLARHRLPDAVRGILATPLGSDVAVPRMAPVAVGAGDEIGEVTAALNTAQDSALGLAIEQAVLRHNIADSFVNLGRRNQNLLSRQLDFITELESNETDPDTLASLFQLDHLATRMRRNAESLLVLAGIEPPRRWTAPVRITDAIRAALGEVEDFERVVLEAVEPALVMGSTAADLAHLLAELVENALTYSPPGAAVVVRGRWRDREGYRLTVVDQGIGMSPEAVAAANRRLGGDESYTVAPSKYLGHYVAGNLAARHGIRVQLAAAPDQGTAAAVDVPFELLVREDRPGLPAAAGPGLLRGATAGWSGGTQA